MEHNRKIFGALLKSIIGNFKSIMGSGLNLTTPTTTTTAAPTTSQPTQTADSATTTEQSPAAVNTASLNGIHTSVCLLKTAIANVSSERIAVEGHILFDEGAQCSFITQDLADELQLQPTGH